MTRRVILLILLILGIACLLTLFVSYRYDSIFSDDMSRYVPIWWVGNSYVGEIVSIQDGMMLVKNTEMKDEKSFRIQPGATRTVLLGAEALHPGMTVKVTYKETKQELIARSIREVRTSETAPPTAPSGEPPGPEGTTPPPPGGPAGTVEGTTAPPAPPAGAPGEMSTPPAGGEGEGSMAPPEPPSNPPPAEGEPGQPEPGKGK